MEPSLISSSGRNVKQFLLMAKMATDNLSHQNVNFQLKTMKHRYNMSRQSSPVLLVMKSISVGRVHMVK